MNHTNPIFFSLLFSALILPLPAAALTIDVTTTDLGTGVWRYSYQLNSATFNEYEGFTIYFDDSLYGPLSHPTGSTDWDILTFDPDSNIPADGFFDALALVRNASLLDPFTVDFVWLGSGTPPGTQPVEAYVCLDPFNCDDISPHPTIPPGSTGGTGAAPLPSSLTLLVAGLISLGVRRARMKY